MPGSSSWISYAPQGVKGFEEDDVENYRKFKTCCPVFCFKIIRYL